MDITKNKLLIIPGYTIGLGCLFLITYRTIIAFLSDTKAVTVHIDKFGEQYFDLIALGIIWVICLVGLVILFGLLKKEKIPENFNYEPDRIPTIAQDYSLFEINNGVSAKMDKRNITGVMAEVPSNTNKELKLDD